ncbi:hypothetical protein [Streptomyces boncukensis]|uniref:Uncharacterized protein n=1 Tax=Streptomyces boncukensis TaxID=2711219 RepID=A0A6G4WWN3_9ACTN|nr:hypothetical protein [Streptomyces boncukensis]NGO69696.1 hypothetical protein [Streptomyces boncukensis]
MLTYTGGTELERIWLDQDAKPNNWTKGNPSLSTDLQPPHLSYDLRSAVGG